LSQLEHHVQHAVPRQAAFGAFCAVADCRESGFNRVTGADTLPVLGREIKESHQFLAVFLQA
jgi:hypothetical protein